MIVKDDGIGTAKLKGYIGKSLQTIPKHIARTNIDNGADLIEIGK
jgi:hypothetical protein